jgi:hypothetical protein
MEEQVKFHLHLSSLLTAARLKKGYPTLRELYRKLEPSIDYQTWQYAESGRRVPTPTVVLTIGDILDIDRESLIVAYCKDKFDDPKSEQVLKSLQFKNYLNADSLLDAKEHDRTKDYIFNREQTAAIDSDVRLRLYLNYTYDENLKTNVSRLADFFSVEKQEAQEVIERLCSLGLVELYGEEVKKIHQHTTLLNTPETFSARKKSLLKSLELTIKPNSYTANYHINLSEKSYKKIIAIFEFVEASLIKMEQEDISNQAKTSRYQISMTGNLVH